MLTYPRTDSRALPEDYIDTVKQVLRNLQGSHLGTFASKILQEGWVKPNKRIFNNAKISDHFAITPTLESPDKLDDIERKVYDMVAKRFLSVFYPAAQFEVTTRITRVEGEPFKTEGKILRLPRLARNLRPRGTGRGRSARAGAGAGKRDGEDARRSRSRASRRGPRRGSRKRRCSARWKARAS